MVDLTGPSKEQGAETRWKFCPSCGRDTWSVSASEATGAWTCYACGAGGAVDVGITANRLQMALTPTLSGGREWPEIELPPWRDLTRTGRKFLRDRGVSTPEDFGIVELEEGGRILIPYFGQQGRLIYWATRYLEPDGQPKYLGAQGMKPPYVLPDWSKHEQVVFMEGPMDAIIHYLATGVASIALGGTSVSPTMRATLRELAGGDRTLILDHDALTATLKLGGMLEAKVVRLPPREDPASFYGKGLL
jgi:DNA primase